MIVKSIVEDIRKPQGSTDDSGLESLTEETGSGRYDPPVQDEVEPSAEATTSTTEDEPNEEGPLTEATTSTTEDVPDVEEPSTEVEPTPVGTAPFW